jgi:hypothetical protein
MRPYRPACGDRIKDSIGGDGARAISAIGCQKKERLGFPGFRIGIVGVIDELNKAINAGLAAPKIEAQFSQLNNVPIVMTPADFGKFMADETENPGG